MLTPLSALRGLGFMFWKMLLRKDGNSHLHFHPEGKQEVSLKGRFKREREKYIPRGTFCFNSCVGS